MGPKPGNNRISVRTTRESVITSIKIRYFFSCDPMSFLKFGKKTVRSVVVIHVREFGGLGELGALLWQRILRGENTQGKCQGRKEAETQGVTNEDTW